MRKPCLVVVVTAIVQVAAVSAVAAGDEGDSRSEEVRAQVGRTMAAFAAMDVAAFKAGLAEDAVGFEMDLENRPVRLGSRAEAGTYASEMFAQLKGMGARVILDVNATECEVVSDLAYCTVEFDFRATMENSEAMIQPSRNTVVLRRKDVGWEWAHWHSSLAPAMPAANAGQ